MASESNGTGRKRFVAYLRVSTQRQGQSGLGLEASGWPLVWRRRQPAHEAREVGGYLSVRDPDGPRPQNFAGKSRPRRARRIVDRDSWRRSTCSG